MKTKCSNCKYGWESGSKLIYVTCPNCQLKTRRLNDEKEVKK